ncbi:hypothetical protein FSARC_4191 [Fusarium sarcochroum]|uniref:Uncharacterized protein n=1 Tax=Fusarium sarcochroum TaxID=1208366 RepID=A0A8H4U2Q1_9HYPO|nr:hypothetical protein FSARC_4191 [Fusarium sarcochroum]
MAHQAGVLPWDTFASIFELKDANPCQHDAKDFHPRDDPDNSKRLSDFTETLLRKAFADARLERTKYAEIYEAPDENEVIVTDEVAKRITSTIERWQPEDDGSDLDDESTPVKHPRRRQLCPHTNESDICKCALPFKERKMSAFQRSLTYNGCHEFESVNGEAFRNLEIVKTLLLHGEMEPILRACAYPLCGLGASWEEATCDCMSPDLGWDRMCLFPIQIYIMLNLVYCFPETWDRNGSPIDNYGDIKTYQFVIRNCTRSSYASEIPTYPHRKFFGIEKGQFNLYPEPYDLARWIHIMKRDDDFNDMEYYPFGLISWQEFYNFEKPIGYQPHVTDIPQVRAMLCHKSLPVELADMILETASYTPKRSLPVFGKPFHPQNRAELDRYLDQCWQLIVRCIMMGYEVPHMDIEFLVRELVKQCLWETFGCECAFRLFFPA